MGVRCSASLPTYSDFFRVSFCCGYSDILRASLSRVAGFLGVRSAASAILMCDCGLLKIEEVARAS